MSKTKKRILLVEDEADLASVLRSKLEKEGYEVDGAEDGEEGYRKIKEDEPDLILLDIVMPKMDGYRVLEKMQEDDIHIPVIIISNSGQPLELEKTEKMGAVDHLVKTQFDPKEVIDKVTAYLEKEKEAKEKDRKKAEQDSDKEDGNDIKVLVVEDDSFLRDLLTRELSKKGFTVFEAVDGEKALSRLERIEPDMILLDIILPAVDGFEVLEQIRGHRNDTIKNVPVLMLSNLGEKDDVKRAKELGANDYMIKAHFTTKDVTKKIKEVLNID
jgi:DNA-binding response OmpR family regulator